MNPAHPAATPPLSATPTAASGGGGGGGEGEGEGDIASTTRAPEPRRLRLLREAFLRAVAKVSGMDRPSFDREFPPPNFSHDDRTQLFDMLQQSLVQYAQACREEFDPVMREHHAANKLADLERLCAERGVMEGIPAEAVAAAEQPQPRVETAKVAHARLLEEKAFLLQMLAEAQKDHARANEALQERQALAQARVQELKGVGETMDGIRQVNQQWAGGGGGQ